MIGVWRDGGGDTDAGPGARDGGSRAGAGPSELARQHNVPAAPVAAGVGARSDLRAVAGPLLRRRAPRRAHGRRRQGVRRHAAGKPARNAAPPAVPVTAADSVEKTVPIQLTAVGNAMAYTTVGIKSQVNGQIVQVHFKEGQDVRKDDLLFTIDPRPFEAALRQAEAALRQRQAEVQQAIANLERDTAQLANARVQERRYKALVEKELVAREQYDQLQTNLAAMEATVQADRAAVENANASERAAQANVDNARLLLGYTEIRAPIDGRTGNR